MNGPKYPSIERVYRARVYWELPKSENERAHASSIHGRAEEFSSLYSLEMDSCIGNAACPMYFQVESKNRNDVLYFVRRLTNFIRKIGGTVHVP